MSTTIATVTRVMVLMVRANGSQERTDSAGMSHSQRVIVAVSAQASPTRATETDGSQFFSSSSAGRKVSNPAMSRPAIRSASSGESSHSVCLSMSVDCAKSNFIPTSDYLENGAFVPGE
ncbi:MAG: hypothetical protein DRI48_07980 [Chloroflexi bacterium]|nr:MAG: hypothetical protein DRI48_07980 [Chloroflexota bacterium]